MVKKLTGMKWLRAHMEQEGWKSLEEVGDRCHLNRGNLYRYFIFETRPSIDMIPVLCDGLKITVPELLRVLEVEKTKVQVREIKKMVGVRRLSLVTR